MSATITFADFIKSHLETPAKIPASIRQRWGERVVPRGLHTRGLSGGCDYLRDYGKSIGGKKLIHFALLAEHEGYPAFAHAFWAKAFHDATGQSAPDYAGGEGGAAAPQGGRDVSAATSGPSAWEGVFPDDLIPGALITAQPIDAPMKRANYIASPRYYGQPKRDGERLVVFAGRGMAMGQSRSLAIRDHLDSEFSAALVAAAADLGPFVLDGELTFLDAAGGEHRTGAQAAHVNAEAGRPQDPVRARFCAFKALYSSSHGGDLRQGAEDARIAAGASVGDLVIRYLDMAGASFGFEVVPTARTAAEKQALADSQHSEGREGEVWIDAQAPYSPGKKSASLLRTKYLEETIVAVIGLTKTTVAGRPFGAIEVADVGPDGSLIPCGSVGTGFNARDARDLAQAFASLGNALRIEVRHQGRTERGQLWHARYLRPLAA